MQYRLAWCHKRGKPVLVGEVKERLEQIIRQVAEELGVKVLELAINPDHVHPFISAYPTIPVHKFVRRIRGIRSKKHNGKANSMINNFGASTILSEVSKRRLKSTV